MHGFLTNIEQATLSNTDYRRVLYTSSHLQLVLMSIAPGDEIGEEVHHLDQFIRIESGQGTVILEGDAHGVQDDDAIIIPDGTKHNVINTGTTDLKLYSIYTPPEHKDGTVHPTKADDQEEHFDGVTSAMRQSL